MGAWTLKDTWWMERGVKEWIKHHFIIKVNRMVPVWGIFGRKSYFLWDLILPISNELEDHLSHVLCCFFLLFPEEELHLYFFFFKVFILERRGKDLFWKGCYCTFMRKGVGKGKPLNQKMGGFRMSLILREARVHLWK